MIENEILQNVIMMFILACLWTYALTMIQKLLAIIKSTLTSN